MYIIFPCKPIIHVFVCRYFQILHCVSHFTMYMHMYAQVQCGLGADSAFHAHSRSKAILRQLCSSHVQEQELFLKTCTCICMYTKGQERIPFSVFFSTAALSAPQHFPAGVTLRLHWCRLAVCSDVVLLSLLLKLGPTEVCCIVLVYCGSKSP